MRWWCALLVLCFSKNAAAVPAVTTGFTATEISSGAPLVGPGGLAIDGSRILIVEPNGNGASGDSVLSYTHAGASSNFAQPAGAAFCTISQVAINGFTLDAYVFDTASNTLQIINGLGMVTARGLGITGGGNCTDAAITGLATHPGQSFALYGASPHDGKLYFINPVAGTVQAAASNLGTPTQVAVNIATGDVLVLDIASGTVYRLPQLNPMTQAVTLNPPTPLLGIAVSPFGQLFGIDGAGNILAVASSGDVSTFACGFSGISQLAFGRATGHLGNNLYVTQYGATPGASDGDAIYEIDGNFGTAAAVGNAVCAAPADAGVSVDAAPALDAAPLVDAGTSSDATAASDLGVIEDAADDAGPPLDDAALLDLGTFEDAAPIVDSGAGFPDALPRPDAGVIAPADAALPDAGSAEEGSGCGCSTAGPELPWALLGLAALFLLRKGR
ncbi:MAG: MYXO-CTERM sorting domain-containing protein [Myxococcota bacterium]